MTSSYKQSRVAGGRGRFAPLLAGLLCTAASWSLQAQNRSPNLPHASAVPQGNPCQDPTVHHWIQQPEGAVRYVLFDGAEKLRSAPQKLVDFPRELPANYEPTCMVYAVDFDAQGRMKTSSLPRPYTFGRKRKDPQNTQARNPWPTPEALDVYVRAGLKVLPEIVNGGFVHREIKPDSTTLIAVPLWREHAIYTGDKSQIWSADLRGMGFADAWKLGDRSGVTIYEVGHWRTGSDGFLPNKISPNSRELTRPLYRGKRTFVVVRSFTPDEPILPEPAMQIAWLDKFVSPHLSYLAKGEGVGIDLLTYARGVTYPAIPRNNDGKDGMWYPLAKLDPLTEEPVERPVSDVTVSGVRDRVSGELKWELRDRRSPDAAFNSLAALEKRAQLLTDRRAANAAVAAQMRDQRLTQQKADAAKKAELEVGDSRAAAAKGLIYRSPRYWLRFDRSELLSGILNGSGVGTDTYEFMSVYVNYHGWFSNECSSWVPSGSPGVVTGTTTTTKHDQIGVTSWNEPTLVRQRYWEKYQAYRGSMADFWMEGVKNLSASHMAQVMATANGEVESMNEDMQRLFDDNACDSGLLNQFEENLYRLAHGKTPLQQASGQRYSYAAKDVVKGEAASSLADVCMDHGLPSVSSHLGLSEQLDNRRRIRRWCRCLDGRASRILKREEVQAAIEDFTGFDKKLMNIPKGGEQDPDWRYYDGVGNGCRGR